MASGEEQSARAPGAPAGGAGAGAGSPVAPARSSFDIDIGAAVEGAGPRDRAAPPAPRRGTKRGREDEAAPASDGADGSCAGADTRSGDESAYGDGDIVDGNDVGLECRFCGKCWRSRSALAVHERRHTGEKPYACGVCGQRFSEIGSMKFHERTHSGERLSV